MEAHPRCKQQRRIPPSPARSQTPTLHHAQIDATVRGTRPPRRRRTDATTTQGPPPARDAARAFDFGARAPRPPRVQRARQVRVRWCRAGCGGARRRRGRLALVGHARRGIHGGGGRRGCATATLSCLVAWYVGEPGDEAVQVVGAWMREQDVRASGRPNHRRGHWPQDAFLDLPRKDSRGLGLGRDATQGFQPSFSTHSLILSHLLVEVVD
ncbi:hypothetical protein BC826DRAFT_581787 [Russula brevipes]|nr:hypothetical protein BC826DRAFT_581787 [Russula brevipes]